MIPSELVENLEAQAEFNPYLRRPEGIKSAVMNAFDELSISPQAEIANVLLPYRLNAVSLTDPAVTLFDIIESSWGWSILAATSRAREDGLDKRFVCIGRQDHSLSVLCNDTGLIFVLFDDQVSELNEGLLAPVAGGFFEFLIDRTLPAFIADPTAPDGKLW